MNHIDGCQCSNCLGLQITNTGYGAEFNPHGWGLQHLHHVASPIYNNRADYNTDSKSYYDYLARQNEFFTSTLVPQVNRLLRRDLTLTETKSIKPLKTGSWTGKPCSCQSTGGQHMMNCDCYCYDDVIDLQENVKLSPLTKPFTHTGSPDRTLDNAISIEGTDAKDLNSGIWSPDYSGVIGDIIDKNNSQDTIINGIIQKNKDQDDAINHATTEAGKHTTIVKGSGINMTTGTNANGGIQYTISSPIGNMPSGEYHLSAKETMWSTSGSETGATSGNAVKPFSNGSYSVSWTVNGNLGFSTDIAIATGAGNNNITWQTIDEGGGISTYSCHISVTGAHWTATSTFVKISSSGSVTTGTTTGFSIQQISRLVNVDMHFG